MSLRRIDRAETIELLASGLRQEIVDTLRARTGEATARELALDLGRSADGLYYHLKLLTQGGLLEERSSTNEDGREERRYRLRGGSLALRYRPGNQKNISAVQRVVSSMLRLVGRDFAAALQKRQAVVEGPRREVWASRGKGWVDDEQLEEINRLLERLNEILDGRRRPGCDRLMTLCFVLAPNEVQPVRRQN